MVKSNPPLLRRVEDSKQAPHVSPRRKDRSKGSKKGVGSSCCTRKDFILVLLQISAVFWVVFSKHPPKNFHLHFPLPTRSSRCLCFVAANVLRKSRACCVYAKAAALCNASIPQVLSLLSLCDLPQLHRKACRLGSSKPPDAC